MKRYEFKVTIEVKDEVPKDRVKDDLAKILTRHTQYFEDKYYVYKSATVKKYRTPITSNQRIKVSEKT